MNNKSTILTYRVYQILMFLFVSIAFSGCIVFTGVSMSKDYEMLHAEEKSKIKTLEQPIDSLTYDENLYLVKTQELKDYLSAQQDSVMLYFLLPFCESEDRIEVSEFEEYCAAHNYKPCVILDRYTEWLGMYDGKSPLLMIDPAQWDTDKVVEYYDNIYKSLTGETLGEDDYYIYMLFYAGQFQKNIKSLGVAGRK